MKTLLSWSSGKDSAWALYQLQVDPCGENGEFHSFAFAGPMFCSDIPFSVGDTVERDGFVFTDLLPADKRGELHA